MRTEPLPDLVEMIDDDVDLFGDRAPVAPLKERRGSAPRWVGPVAAAALLAVVGYNVVSSAVSATPKTKRDPNIVEPEYFVADPPAGFGMHLAEERGAGATGTAADFADSGPAQLWATVDATATTGSWFVISQGTHHATGRNSYRTIVDGFEAVIEHDPPSGQSRVSFTKDGQPVEITSFGWVDRQLVRLVRSVSVANSVIQFSNPFFTTDHRQLLDADPATALFGQAVSRVGYSTAVPPTLAQHFTITVAVDRHPTDRATVTKFALTGVSPLKLGDRSAIVGRSSADPTMSVVQWDDGKRLITVEGNVDPDQLSAIAGTVHRGSASAVQEQLGSAPAIEALQTAPDTIASGMLGDGWAWAIQVSVAPGAGNPVEGYLWWIAQPSDSIRPSEIRPSLAAGIPTIETMVEHGRTYVLAKVPRSMTGAFLRISPTGLGSTVSPLFDVDAKFADEFTAAVFDEPVPFTAQIVDRDGTTVAFWPPP
ncbi:MAG: hypothetical protein ABI706_09330 [Ilumatobacteraceae bacterium]